jgi:hypothetical protein
MTFRKLGAIGQVCHDRLAINTKRLKDKMELDRKKWRFSMDRTNGESRRSGVHDIAKGAVLLPAIG